MNKDKKIIIAIDGPAASGKGTIARILAEKLNLSYMDTGILYRLVAKSLLDAGQSPENEEEATKTAKHIIRIYHNTDKSDPALRTEEVSNATSKVSAIPKVREVLNDLQRNFAQNPESGKNGSVLDGRDIGTIICPDADLKLFITADIKERAKRRTKELQSRGTKVTYNSVLADMQSRDARDAGRKTAPTKIADDAIVIDTTNMDIDEAVQEAIKALNETAYR